MSSLHAQSTCNSQQLLRTKGRKSVAQLRQQRRPAHLHRGVKRQLATTVRAGPIELDEEDLLQIPDRANWYETKFAADDMPDWIPATYIRSTDVAPGLRNIVLQHEVSRERVPLRNAYKCAGQRASVRVNSGLDYTLAVASAPPSMDDNREALFKLKGDIFAEGVKVVTEATSILGELHVLLSRQEAPEVWDLEVGDAVEVGPFVGAGLDLRSSAVCAIYRYPTVVMFVTGAGIATAKALLESDTSVPNLGLNFRDDVRMYYLAPNESSFVYRQHWDDWEERGCKVLTTTRSFHDAFDDDQTLMYDPEATAAVILTGGDEEAEAAAREVCKEAEITAILSDSQDGVPPVYLSSAPKSFQIWAK